MTVRPRVPHSEEPALLCFRLTMDTGSIVECWELDSGEFELLFAEAHRPEEVVHVVTVRPVEAELLAEKLALVVGGKDTDV